MERVNLKTTGLKCDYCDYKDDSIKREDYESCIDKPCPKCGENLLTLEDYNNVLILEQAIKLTNEMPQEEIDKLTSLLTDEDVNKLESWIVDTHKGIKFIKDSGS